MAENGKIVLSFPEPECMLMWINLQFKDYKTRYGLGDETFIPFNLPGFDITKWPRALRAKWSFGGEDPLAGISDKDLKEGNLAFGPM